MSSVNLDVWMKHILPSATGCPDDMALNMLRITLIDFCKTTRFYRYIADPASTIKNIAEYEPDIPEETVVHEITRVRLTNREIHPITLDQLNRDLTNWDELTGKSEWYTQIEMTTIRLVPKPDSSAPAGLKFYVTLIPTPSAKTVDDSLYNHFSEGIASGTLAKLLAMGGREWSNPNAVSYHARIYRASTNEARAIGAKHFTQKAKHRVKGHHF